MEEGTEAINPSKSEPVAVAHGTGKVQEVGTGTHTFAVPKDVRDDPAYRFGKSEQYMVTLMSDGELRIKRLADLA